MERCSGRSKNTCLTSAINILVAVLILTGLLPGRAVAQSYSPSPLMLKTGAIEEPGILSEYRSEATSTPEYGDSLSETNAYPPQVSPAAENATKTAKPAMRLVDKVPKTAKPGIVQC